MRTVEEVRHARLLELLAEFPTTQALADKLLSDPKSSKAVKQVAASALTQAKDKPKKK